MPLQFTYSVGGRAVWSGGANTTLVVAGNNSVSNIASASETVQSAYIKGLRFSTSNNILIQRNGAVVAQLYGTDHWENVEFTENATSNIVVTFNGNGTLHMILHKTSRAL